MTRNSYNTQIGIVCNRNVTEQPAVPDDKNVVFWGQTGHTTGANCRSSGRKAGYAGPVRIRRFERGSRSRLACGCT